MKVTTNTVFDILSRLRVYFLGDDVTTDRDEEPFRSELFSSDQMNKHGIIVARSHKLLRERHTDKLLKRLDDNSATLLEVRNLMVESIRSAKAITPGAEWLLDNFYLVEEQIVIAKKHLPKGYSEALPYLSGANQGLPRVYDIGLEIITHSDGRVDITSLSSFIAAYQTISVLTLGELWAIPIMLRLAVIENIRRVSAKIALDMIDHNLADYWADKMIAIAKDEPENLILAIADMAKSRPVLNSSFVAGFMRKLQGKGPSLALALNWMEQQLSASGLNSSDLVQQENQKQAANQVSVRNSIGTLRMIGATDWREFVETLSHVEQILRQDPGGIYPLMDFATRDMYRHVIEMLSSRSSVAETEVAQKVIQLAESNLGHTASGKHGHVGYYLIDKGLPQAEREMGVQYPLRQRVRRFAGKAPLAVYLSSITALTLTASISMLWFVHQQSGFSVAWLCVFGLVFTSGTAQLAISLVNWLSTIWVRPTLLPRMDLSLGVPVECRTLIVVPTMLSGMEGIEEQIEALEIRFLANREANLHFGLLTDMTDADAESLPEDKELLTFAESNIRALNEKYKTSENDVFFLFHRPRLWNANERKWMGYERKRGKVSALNALLRNKGKNEFSSIVGGYEILRNTKYVITLDSDTQLPREAAVRAIATMAHPLNHPVNDAQQRRVTEGYGILQPRVASGIPKSTSFYLRMRGDVAGIDPYTRVSSDVYQDLFGEGSFIGKGIYDVDKFEQVLGDVFPENRILSHDLLEGSYIRSGLLSDVILYEEDPYQYRSDIKRHHRWIRGDWQIGAWMTPFIPDSKGAITRNKLPALSRWKIFDNIRRSLVPVALVLILLLGWFALPFPWIWTLSVTIIILLSAIIATSWQLIHKPEDLGYRAHLDEVGRSIKGVIVRFIFGIAVLPYEAYRYMEAILIANLRMIFTKRKLLEWNPSANARSIKNNLVGVYGSMLIVPLLSALCIVVMAYTKAGSAFCVASPILLLWLLAPAIVWWMSQPEGSENQVLPEEQTVFLHKAARKTWSYFEEFVVAEDNYLPPDNYQEHPVAVIAHRTSPTNIGLALLSNLTAYDFGYISGGELISRCSLTIGSMLKLERYKGHFLNWYDTVTLQPLNPRYVSTVDSGNLIGHLYTLRQGLLSLPAEPIMNGRMYEGIITTINVVKDLSEGADQELLQQMLESANAGMMGSLRSVKEHLDEMSALVNKIDTEPDEETVYSRWVERLLKQIEALRNDIVELAPWVNLSPVPARFGDLSVIESIPSLASFKNTISLCLDRIHIYGQQENDMLERDWLANMQVSLEAAAVTAADRLTLIHKMSDECEELFDVSYEFLFNVSTNLLRIGYNVDEQRKDDSSYDLLASEARLGIFVGIAQGKLPQDSWFALGRLLTNSGGDPILLSWSGSMFEYLMPQLVMPAYENTLLYQTNKATVRKQIEYAEQQNVPWGISESAYNATDAQLNYQYRAFGVPGLGLKRGLDEDLVIAPYATMLALMVSPAKACLNLQVLSDKGFEGEYGFYEAIDYTPTRLPRGESNSVIRSFMVHHQGMSLLAMSYQLLSKPMQQRFVTERRFQATILLLQERIPRATLFYAHTSDIIETHAADADLQVRKVNTPDTDIPEIQLLSNGNYQVMITNSGGGYSRWKGIAVTRWREDTTKDSQGVFCYIKDVHSGAFWSNTFHPTVTPGKNYEVLFSQGHAEFHRLDEGIETKTEIVVSPEDDTEMRRLRITNKGQSVRVLEITSYAEVVLAPHASDESHPAFSNLFVQTEIVKEYNAILSTRRARSSEEVPPWMFHTVNSHGTLVEAVSYETDRMKFIGRGNTLIQPFAMEHDALSGTAGAVLDPIVSIRYRISVKPDQTATVDLIFGISDTRAGCESLMHKYRDQYLKKRAFELSWTHSQVLLRQIKATETDAQLFNSLAASIIYANPALRAEASVILNNYRGQSGLWSHSVSGDLPIVLLHIQNAESIDLVKQMVQAHAYWRLKGLAVDLVVCNNDHGSYRQLLQEQISGLITAEGHNNVSSSRPGNIFVRHADQMSDEDRILFESVARIIIYDDRGSLAEQVYRNNTVKQLPPLLVTSPEVAEDFQQDVSLPDDLLFYNGTGGFAPDGKEYKILVSRNGTTPAPWVNVIANAHFGSVVSESGSAYTWAINAHEYRITPWSNDPVSDRGGEAFYIRDEETGVFWSPSPYPAKGKASYIIIHGFGYSTFDYKEHGIGTHMSVFVHRDLPVKYVVLKIRNLSNRKRQLSATGFLDMVLGDVRSKTNMNIVSEYHTANGALLFRNRYNTAFADRITFFKVLGASQLTITANRAEFIGRNRSLEDPMAMHRKSLSGKCGAGIDSCAALQEKFELLEGAEREIVFIIGGGENAHAVDDILKELDSTSTHLTALDNVKAYWSDIFGAVQVSTPDTALNLLANGWLTYQTIVSRLFARSGFYQSGGAFGFRDQLQDVLSLLHSQPQMAREQILLNASRQFVEGDVQHWWHPPEGRGVRTKCSDDLLWLPFAVSKYVNATGDKGILEVMAGFLQSRILQDHEESVYDLPSSGYQEGTLYDHCVRAIERSLKYGPHGLPLIGSGDWNDGMDKVGEKGLGESLWLAFFLYDVLMRFSGIANERGDTMFAENCKTEAAALRKSIETYGWDGQWYLRAYFDDGTPLGSQENSEGRIDAIVQSWSVLSGAADSKRAAIAMESVNKHLVKRDIGIIQLLDPAFDTSLLNPGYIKGYVPGVRENGGQYSHAAIWVLMAYAAIEDRDKAWELFSLINPINHASIDDDIQVYKVEPYVMAADVYANESHRGRGGWTWYTGSSGWMYQFIIGSLLGVELAADRLRFKPCFPMDWSSVSIRYRYKSSVYSIKITQLEEGLESWWKMDDRSGKGNEIDLLDDGLEHNVEVYIVTR